MFGSMSGVGRLGGLLAARGAAVGSPSALRQAASVLRGVVGDAFSSRQASAGGVLPQGGALSSPLGGLAQRLISHFAPALSTLSTGSLARQLGQATGATALRALGNFGSQQSAATGSVVTPSLADRGAPLTLADFFGAAGTFNYPTPNTYNSATNPYAGFASAAAPSSAGSLSSGAVGSLPTSFGSSAAAATAASGGGDFESGLLSSIQGPPAMPANVKDERQMLEYQRAMQLYTAMVQMVTQVMQMLHEARKNIIQNLRA